MSIFKKAETFPEYDELEITNKPSRLDVIYDLARDFQRSGDENMSNFVIEMGKKGYGVQQVKDMVNSILSFRGNQDDSSDSHFGGRYDGTGPG